MTNDEPQQHPSFVRFSLTALAAAILLLLLLTVQAALSLAAGVDMRGFSQNVHDSTTQTSTTRLVAQSFTSNHANLSYIDIQLSDEPAAMPADGRIRLLSGDGLTGPPVYEAALNTATYTENTATKDHYLSISLPPIHLSNGATYTLILETPNRSLNTAFGVLYNSYDALSSGHMYTAEGVQSGDLAIALRYRYTLPMLASDIANAATQNAPLIIVWTLLLLLPGLALLSWLPANLTPGQRLLAAPAFTALALPILYLAAHVINVKVDSTRLWALLALSAVAIAVRILTKDEGRRTKADVQKQSRLTFHISRFKLRPSPADVAFWSSLTAVFTLTLISRLASLRDLLSGVGLDAYHHTLITKLFVDRTGIPADYEPYAPLASFTYHYGFHSLGATIAMLSGHTSITDIMGLMPQVGQIATTLPILSLTVFGWKVLNNRWAGLAAGALAGLISVIPAYYVNWSRFTQGLGLALLPLAWLTFLQAVESVKREDVKREGRNHISRFTFHVSRLTPAIIASAGLALTHYRVLIMFAAFAGLYLFLGVLRSLYTQRSRGEILAPILRATLIAVGALIVFLPWVSNLRSNFTRQWVGTAASVQSDYYSFERLGPDILEHPSIWIMFLLALGGVAWTIKHRNFLPLLPALTWVILGIWSNPALLPVRLPYSGYLDSITLTSAAWLPLAILGGCSLVWLGNWLLLWTGKLSIPQHPRTWQLATRLTLGVSALLIGAASAFSLSPISDPLLYVTPSDMEALTWMRDNLPRDTYVLGNPFSYPKSTSVLGSDAGVWVPFVTGLRSSIPPTPAYNERPIHTTYFTTTREIMTYSPLKKQQAKWQALKKAGITHIYIGSRGGLLSVPDILNSSQADEIYHEDAVYIFRLR